MEKIKDYLFLHLCVALFSFTSVFSKLASIQYNRGGLANPLLYVFVFLMFFVCFAYAICWQKIIKRFDLNIGYANRSVYLLWSQIWAVFLFRNCAHRSRHCITERRAKRKRRMSMLPYLLLMFAATFFSAISQVLLKQSAGRTYKSVIYEYLNWRVIVAYGISFSVLLLNTYAYTVVPMKYGAVIDTFTYVFVMGLSYLILKEHFTRGQLIGNLIIISGVLVYTL